MDIRWLEASNEYLSAPVLVPISRSLIDFTSTMLYNDNPATYHDNDVRIAIFIIPAFDIRVAFLPANTG